MFEPVAVAVPDLTGKTVLVAGAGRGIGAALVRQLVAAGATVFAGYHGAAEMSALAGAVTFALDPTDPASVAAAAGQVSAFAGRLDALVDASGLTDPGREAGLQRLTVACLPLLGGRGGVVLAAGTAAATTPGDGGNPARLARMIGQMQVQMLAPGGIRAHVLAVPPTDWPRHPPGPRSAAAALVSPEVPASVMAWLCSDAAAGLDDLLLDLGDDRFRALMRAQLS